MVAGMLGRMGGESRATPGPGRCKRNRRGYFEDVELVEFHGRMFRELLPSQERGHVDWGWTESAAIDPSRMMEFAGSCRKLINERQATAKLWGFKDPRATLALDLWRECAPGVRYVLVYRFPWEVSDSMQRGGAPVFEQNPSYGYRIWEHYNTQLLDFFERHRESCLLLSANALPGALPRIPELLSRKLGLELAALDLDLSGSFEPGLFRSGDVDDRRADLVAAAYPGCTRLLNRLDELAKIFSAVNSRS